MGASRPFPGEAGVFHPRGLWTPLGAGKPVLIPSAWRGNWSLSPSLSSSGLEVAGEPAAGGRIREKWWFSTYASCQDLSDQFSLNQQIEKENARSRDRKIHTRKGKSDKDPGLRNGRFVMHLGWRKNLPDVFVLCSWRQPEKGSLDVYKPQLTTELRGASETGVQTLVLQMRHTKCQGCLQFLDHCFFQHNKLFVLFLFPCWLFIFNIAVCTCQSHPGPFLEAFIHYYILWGSNRSGSFSLPRMTILLTFCTWPESHSPFKSQAQVPSPPGSLPDFPQPVVIPPKADYPWVLPSGAVYYLSPFLRYAQ